MPMMLRTFTYRVPKGKERVMLRFMNSEVRRMLRRIPGCRAVFFASRQGRKREYIWVSLWSSNSAFKKAGRHKDWKALGVKEHKMKFFAGRPGHAHYNLIFSLK